MKVNFSQLFKGKDTTEKSNSFVETVTENNHEDAQMIRPKLTFEAQSPLSDETKFLLKYKHRQEAPMLENQVSLSAYDMQITEDGLEVHFFIRHTLDKEIRFETTPIVLINDENRILARSEVPLHELGTLPPLSSRVSSTTFFCDMDGLDLSQLKIAFEIPKEHSLEIDPKWADALSTEQVQQLEELLSKLPKLADGELNFTVINGRLQENGLLLSLLIRNGNKQRINIEVLPVEVLTMDQIVLAKGTFTFEDLTVSGNTSKPWSLLFPTELLTHTPESLQRLSLRVAE